MHFCFVDESGTPPSKPNPKKPYFTMGAAIIDCDDWRDIANRIRGFKVRNGVKGEIKWRYFAPHNSQEGNPFLAFSPPERKLLSLEFASIIAGSKVTIIACVVDVGAAFSFPSVTSQQSLYHFAYKPITERFQYFLQDRTDFGIMVADHRGRDSDKMMRSHHAALTSNPKSTRSGYDRLIEGLFLQDSEHSVGIQIADFAAGAIHRYYSTGDAEHTKVIHKRVRRGPGDEVLGYGIVQHPKASFRRNLGGTPGGAVAPTP